MSERASVYLTEKCENLSHLIEFFANKKTGYCKTLDEKRTIFLSQIDFWDWEMDNLIFSFQTFEERSKVWSSYDSLVTQLQKQGLMVKNSVIADIGGKRYERTHYHRPVLNDTVDSRGRYCGFDIKYVPPGKTDNQVFAPVEVLNAVIKQWNALVDDCEKVLDKQSKNAEQFGACILPDLKKFKKKELHV